MTSLPTGSGSVQFGLPIAVWTPQQVQALLSSKGTERYCPQKVDSSSGCAFRQASGFHKNLSHATPNHPAPHRNGALKHDRTETIHEIHSRRPYLREPPPSADGETVHRWREGKRLTGHVGTATPKSQRPPPGTSALNAERTGLLELASL